jgi:glycerol-3-phosphate acyltransferase PlsY
MTMNAAIGVAAFVVGYLLGSIPFGLVLTRLAGLGDIRNIGSGNIGATNVLRTGNKSLAAATLLLDAAKGALAVLVAWSVAPELALWAGAGALIGHLFPAWIGFKGGKGVATYLGVLAALAWPAGIFFAVVWLVTALATRYSSASALLASLLTPLFLFFTGGNSAIAWLFVVLTILLWWRHAQNIRRLMAGSETRIGQK